MAVLLPDARVEILSNMTEILSEPIKRLPDDLLHEIFMLSFPDPFGGEDEVISPNPSYLHPYEKHGENDLIVLPPRNISGVSRHWRDLTYATPALWARWFLTLHDPTKNELRMATEFIRQCISRSGDVSLI